MLGSFIVERVFARLIGRHTTLLKRLHDMEGRRSHCAPSADGEDVYDKVRRLSNIQAATHGNKFIGNRDTYVFSPPLVGGRGNVWLMRYEESLAQQEARKRRAPVAAIKGEFDASPVFDLNAGRPGFAAPLSPNTVAWRQTGN